MESPLLHWIIKIVEEKRGSCDCGRIGLRRRLLEGADERAGHSSLHLFLLSIWDTAAHLRAFHGKQDDGFSLVMLVIESLGRRVERRLCGTEKRRRLLLLPWRCMLNNRH